MISLIDILFTLTMAGRVALAAVLGWLLVSRGRQLRPRARTVWTFIAVVTLVVVVDNLTYELLQRLEADAAPGSALEGLDAAFFNFSYLLHSVLSMALPAVILERLTDGWRRGLALVALLAAAMLFAAAILAGALPSWEVLLRYTRVFSFLGITCYLGFWALLALGELAPVDVYLAVFLGARTVFIILLPIQEVFFEWVGLEAAAEIWHLNQLLQLAMTVVQLGAAAALLRVLARGRSVRHVGAPVPT